MLLCFFFMWIQPLVHAQQLTEENDRKLVRTLKFDGNREISNGKLRTITRTQTNREVFGIPGATLWLSLHSIYSGLGEAPRYLDRNMVGRDIERLTAFYEANGFFDTKIDTTITEFKPGRIRVVFHIDEGEPSYMRTIAYSGLPDFDDERVRNRFYDRSLLGRSVINDTTLSVNRQYSVERISEERNRIINVLRRHGYAAVSRDSISVLVKPDTDEPKQLDLLVMIKPGKIYYFGDVKMNLSAAEPDGGGEVVSDTLSGQPWTNEPFKIVLNIDKKARVSSKLLYNRILFTPGEVFNNDLYLSTVNQLQTLEMLSVQQFSLSETPGLPDFSGTHVPVLFNLAGMPRHLIRSDLFVMQRLGLGAGAGIQYTNNNLFRNAQRLQLGINGSFEYITGAQTTLGDQRLLRNIEATASYTLPFFSFPFGNLNSNPSFLNPQTQFQISVAQVNQINFNINANFRFNLKFQANHSRTTKSFLDLIEMEWFDAIATPEFIQNINDNVSDPLLVQRILEDFRPQFSSTFRYTFRNSATNIIKRDTGFYLETSLELGGTIPFLIEKFAIGRDNIEGTIPSFSLTGQELSYSQFVKGSFDYRKYYKLANRTVFAWRGFAGIAYPYGENRLIPLNRRFFAGGASDIRGWDPLRLGPGNVTQDEITINGGDIKLAGFLELRNTFSENFLSTDWIVSVFTDFGNIWYGPRSDFSTGKFELNSFYKQIAVGSGVGLRLDWDFVIFRVDLAYRLNELGTEPGTKWWQRNVLHFGIGHSF